MMTARLSGTRFAQVAIATLFCALTTASTLPAQTAAAVAHLQPAPQSNRIPANPNFAPQTQLSGHIPAWVVPSAQLASQPVDLGSPLHVSIVLSRPTSVQAAFEQFLADQQNPSSPLFHQWLTPQQVGALFGPTASDLAAVTSWLTSQGLKVDSIAPSHMILEAYGSTASVGNAFHTSFAYFNLNGKARFAAINEPSIPTVLGPVIRSISGLVEVPIEPHSHLASAHIAPAANSTATGNVASPNLTLTSGSTTYHFLAPKDFSLIYDINSVYSAGNTGATIGSSPQHVAIIGRSRVAATDISEYAANTAIGSAYTLNTIIPTTGTDPGVVCTVANQNTCSTGGDQGEQTLDVDRVIGTATGVTADLVVSKSSGTQDGVYIAAAYNVNTLVDPIETISYGSCESGAGSAGVSLWDTLFSAGAAEGIATFVSSGDSGADGCATSFKANSLNYAASINSICSTSYATCVGGTEFNDAATSTYWASSNGTGFESALSYIPEGAWNEPVSGSTYVPASSGGGFSTFISKPSYQTGDGVPVDGHRDVPDVSFSASAHNGYYACLDYAQANTTENCTSAGGGYFVYFSGTSAAAPGMAAVAALLNTKLGAKQGPLNPLLYKLATSTPSVFHDATIATSGVTGCVLTTPSMCNNSTPGASADSTSVTGGLAGYQLATGYDEATGLGSLDVAAFLTAAATTTVSTTLAVTAAPNPAVVNQSVTLTATLTPGTSTFTPTGTVQFYSNGTAIGSAVTIASNVATLTYAFTASGTYSITAVYSGDTNFATSTASAYSEVVNASTFTISPATTSYSLISGAVTGNTDVVTVASTNSFAGTVALTCTVTNISGTAAGTCTILPASEILTSGSSATPTLTILTTPGTSGVLHVTVTGTSGSTIVTSSAVTVTLVASSFTMSASPTTLSLISGTSGTSTVTLTSINGFAGPVALTCAAANTTGSAAGSCAVSPTSVTLTSGGTATSTVTVTSTAATSGTLTATISASGTTTGATIAANATATVVATLTAPTFTFSTPTALSFTSGATSGNSETLTVNSQNTFAGTVALTCAISSGSEYYPPSCAMSPTSVTLTSGGTATSVITITSTTAQAAVSTMHAGFDLRWTLGGGITLLALTLFVPNLRRRRFTPLAVLALLALAGISGCGGSSSPAPSTPKSSAGTYTVTVTGTSGSLAPTTAFTLTIN